MFGIAALYAELVSVSPGIWALPGVEAWLMPVARALPGVGRRRLRRENGSKALPGVARLRGMAVRLGTAWSENQNLAATSARISLLRTTPIAISH